MSQVEPEVTIRLFILLLTNMGSRKKYSIRVVFDVLDEANHQMRQNEDLSVIAADPDEAIDWVFTEMQRQLNQPNIKLARVRICA